MKTLQCNFTTPEQSKRLLELGMPADSADCFWFDEREIFLLKDKLYSDEAKDGEIVRAIDFTPCWSVGRLIEIFCICTDDRWSIEYLNGMPQTIIEKTIEAINGNKVDFSKLEEL